MAHKTPQRYAICIEGCLDQERSVWFEGMGITTSASHAGTTTLTGSVRDQADLHGHIRKIRDLNLNLIFVQRLDDKLND